MARIPLPIICGECGHQHTHMITPEELDLLQNKSRPDTALALLRELNDALAIPGWLQPRVDAVLDRAEEKP